MNNMENINWEKEVESHDIEVSLFLEALIKSEPKLEVEQFGAGKKELPF